jgi:meiotically up-regulated gene 157 (Mug157) protein
MLDAEVVYTEVGGEPLTYIVTGNIDAMWLCDSAEILKMQF